MKIRLIEPEAPSMHLWSHSYFVRLGLPMIGARLKQLGHDVRIYNPAFVTVGGTAPGGRSSLVTVHVLVSPTAIVPEQSAENVAL